MLRVLWWRWLGFGWVGRIASVVVALYGVGWIAGNLGLDSMARQFGSAAVFVLALLLTGLFIRLLWRDSTSHHHRR